MLALCSDVRRPHLAEGLEAGADHVRGGVVHVGEDRVVVGAEAVDGVDDARGRAPALLTASISAGSWTVAMGLVVGDRRGHAR